MIKFAPLLLHIILAACSNSAQAPTPAPTKPVNPFVANVGALLNENQTLSLRAVSAVSGGLDEEKLPGISVTGMEITRLSGGKVKVKALGDKLVFTSDTTISEAIITLNDVSEDGLEHKVGITALNEKGEFNDIKDGQSLEAALTSIKEQSAVIYVLQNKEGTTEGGGLGVVGTHTPFTFDFASELGSAQYKGKFTAVGYDKTQPIFSNETSSTGYVTFDGDVTLNVGLSDGRISGVMDVKYIDGGSPTNPISVVMESSGIDNGEFSGKLTRNNGADIGTYAGDFYGANGQDASGLLTLKNLGFNEALEGNENNVVFGAFVTQKQ